MGFRIVVAQREGAIETRQRRLDPVQALEQGAAISVRRREVRLAGDRAIIGGERQVVTTEFLQQIGAIEMRDREIRIERERAVVARERAGSILEAAAYDR